MRAKFPGAIIGVALLGLLSGCWSFKPAHPQQVAKPQPIPADAWPTRDPAAVRPILEATPHDVFTYKVAEGVDPASLSEKDRKWVDTPQYVVTYKGIHANGLLRIYEQPDEEELHAVVDSRTHKRIAAGSFTQVMNQLMIGFSPNAHIMSSRTLDAVSKRAALEAKMTPPPEKTEASLSIVRPEQAPKFEAIESASHLYLESGLPIRVPPVKEGAKPKGLIIHLHAIAGNEFEPQVMQEFRDRGWVEIELKTEAAIESPIPDAWQEEVLQLTLKSRELARQIYGTSNGGKASAPEDYDEVVRRAKTHPLTPELNRVNERLSKLREGGFQVHSEADLPSVAAAIAHEVDDGLAGASYATQAVLEYVKEARPDLQGIPVVVMGFSAGALATPTCVARVHDQVDAVVMVGGGCDLFRVSQHSSFTDGGLKILCGEDKAPATMIDKLDGLYLKASKLDPYYTAPLIADLPVLQLHGSTDTWVPYACGDMLYERLNYPDRLVISGGHEYLFYFLPGKKEWIADWVERAVAKKRAAR